MNTLEIKKDAALKAHQNAKNSGKLLLENLFGKEVFEQRVTERIKTFFDVLDDQGISTAEFEKQCKGLTPDEIAYKQLKLIAQALNEGWVPDWTDGQWSKFHPYFNFNDTSAVGGFSCNDDGNVNSYSYVGSRLCFKSAELAKYAGTTFLEIYKSFMTL